MKERTIEMQPLADHIAEHYEGNQSAFARAYGIERQSVRQYLTAKKPVYMVGGKIVQIIRDQPKKEGKL